MGTARRRFVGARARRVFHESIPPSKRNRLGKPLRAMCNVRPFDKLVPRRPNMRLVWLYTKIRLGAKKSRLRTCRIVGHLRCVSTFVASGSRTTALRSTEIAASLSCTLNANKYRQQATRCKRRCSRDNKSQAPRQTARQIQHPSSGGNKYSPPPPQPQAPRQPRATKPRDASGDS